MSTDENIALLFQITAHVSNDTLGYKISDFKIEPARVKTIYDPDSQVFNETFSDMKVTTNIPAERKENFFYTLTLASNEAQCDLIDGNNWEYKPPKIFINDDVGDYVQLKLHSGSEFKISNSSLGFKTDNRKIKIRYNEIDSDFFYSKVKSCYGSIKFTIGLL
ncbi:hypothetical protein [Photobacterium damselae]|uniref:hypothetical protein n=1 Tax=Photobacterium damselae TaxID=38293 RepID=UPI001EDF37A8|nr:hypothetical protein [Photobacterium damselae]MCG3846599.1 hypothetical protein [Photobacterium damselae]